MQPNISFEEKEQYLTYIKKSSNRLLSTITNYIDISLIASGNMEVKMTQIELDRIFQQLYEKFNHQCLNKKLQLYFKKPTKADTIQIISDADLMHKIMSHLLDNAVKFTQQGKITFGYVLKSHLCEFFVKDTGTSISKEAQKRIFENFIQEEVSHNRGYEGSGLGLSIAKGLIQILGGEIRVESEISKGTTITFSLPLKKLILNEKKKINKIPLLLKQDNHSAIEEISTIKYLKKCI
jgi:signal transduction histidine kinase